MIAVICIVASIAGIALLAYAACCMGGARVDLRAGAHLAERSVRAVLDRIDDPIAVKTRLGKRPSDHFLHLRR